MAEPCDGNWGQVATWVLVLLGWGAVHVLSLSRERRKERRETATRLVQELLEIEQDAVAFHLSATYDAEAADRLLWRTGRAIRAIQRQPLSQLCVPTRTLTALRRSITISNMDRSSYKQQAPGSALLQGIRHATDALVEQMEAARDRRYA